MIEAVIGLVGVIVGSVITISKDSWALYRERRRDGSYSAIRLIGILDEYVDNCMAVATDNGCGDDGRPAGRTKRGEEFCEAQVQAPQPPQFPSDIAWRSLEASVMHRILALPSKARNMHQYISACAEHAYPPNYSEVFEPRQIGYAKLGIEALEIIEELRRRYNIEVDSVISMMEAGTNWTPKGHLHGVISMIEHKKRESKKRSQAAHSDFQSKSTLSGKEIE